MPPRAVSKNPKGTTPPKTVSKGGALRPAQALAKPKLALEVKCKFPWKLRQAALDKIYDALAGRDGAASLARSVELDIYERAMTRQVYAGLFASKIQELRKPQDGPAADLGPPAVPMAELLQLVHDTDTLRRNGYLFADSTDTRNEEVRCQRCQEKFVPLTYYELAEPGRCRYHEGRKIKIENQRVHPCCQHPVGDPGCLLAEQHVYSVPPRPEDLVDVGVWQQRESALPILAIDAEMVYTTGGCEIARLSAVKWDLEVAFDVLVRPTMPVIDYNTRYSGISADSYETPAAIPVVEFDHLLGTLLPTYIDRNTILVGHSLENDLRVLKILDTSILYPHETRVDGKKSLRDLSKQHLGEFIQQGLDGHDSIQDAATCMRLVSLLI